MYIVLCIMRRLYAFEFVILSFLVFFLLPNVSAADSSVMTVEADIYKFPDFVSIQVPDYFYIGNVTVGFSTDPTSADKIYINNTGTCNASVSVEPLSPNDIIAKNLYFTKRLSGTDYKYYAANNFLLEVPWSGQLGKASDEYFYMKLDLKNASSISNDMVGHKTDVKFIAVAA